MNSSKAGRIISDGNDEWRVEFLPEREEEYKKNKKKRIDAGIEKRKKEDEEKKQEEKRIKAIEKKKKREEEIWHYEQLKKAEIIRKRKKEEIKRKKDRDYYKQSNVFWVPTDARWESLRDKAPQPTQFST